MTDAPRKGRTRKAEAPPVEPEVVEPEVPAAEPEAVEAEAPTEEPEPSFIAIDPAVDDPDVAVEPRRSDLLLELRRPLSYGSHGPNVDRVMRALGERGFYEGPVDGRYGTRLSRSVRRFQSDAGLRVSGDVDGATWLALMEGYTEPAVVVEPEVPATPDDTEPAVAESEPGDEVTDEPIEEPAVEEIED